ncbi:MAG: GNAT family N-acetyltransferase [Firmicutes bacterium]|nr:GNAT family N-acetyltransferase [Bacillota bacterium]
MKNIKDKIIIRKANIQDAKKMVDYFNKVSGESEFFTFREGEYYKSVKEEKEMIRKINMESNSLYLVVEYQDEIIGNLILKGERGPFIRHSVEFGISICKRLWNKGIGNELLTYMIKWCKDNKEIKKINLAVREDNHAIKLYEKVGFKKEGVRKKYMYRFNKFYDAVLMGMDL